MENGREENCFFYEGTNWIHLKTEFAWSAGTTWEEQTVTDDRMPFSWCGIDSWYKQAARVPCSPTFCWLNSEFPCHVGHLLVNVVKSASIPSFHSKLWQLFKCFQCFYFCWVVEMSFVFLTQRKPGRVLNGCYWPWVHSLCAHLHYNKTMVFCFMLEAWLNWLHADWGLLPEVKTC